MHTLPSIEGLAAMTDTALAAFRGRLLEAGYDDAVVGAGEAIAPGQLDALRLPLVHDAWRREPTPARDLALLFSYDADVDAVRVEAALGAEVVASIVGAGLVVRDGDALRCPFRLTPLSGLWVLGDDLNRAEGAVMGPGPTTERLCQTVPASAPARVLDVCCGAGTLALLAALRGATHVVGVDISARAVELARFNARLNALRARFEESDLFAAVTGERYDLVVSQPAFIARPPDITASTFAHGGPMGDELVMRVFAELPAHLAPGGVGVVLLESAVRPNAPLHARLRAALGRAPVDLLVLAARGNGPDALSVGYATLLDPTLGPVWRETMLRYRAHLRAMGVEEFTHALGLIMALPEGVREPRFTITLPLNSLRGFDAEALAQLRASLALATRDDEALLAARVRANPGATYVEERARPDSSLQPRWVVRFTRSAFADRELTESTWVLLGLLDTREHVADALAGYAEACDATPAEVQGNVLSFVRESLARGLLTPA